MDVSFASKGVLRIRFHNLEGGAVSMTSVFPSLAENSRGLTDTRQIHERAFIGTTLNWLASKFRAHVCGVDAQMKEWTDSH